MEHSLYARNLLHCMYCDLLGPCHLVREGTNHPHFNDNCLSVTCSRSQDVNPGCLVASLLLSTTGLHAEACCSHTTGHGYSKLYCKDRCLNSEPNSSKAKKQKKINVSEVFSSQRLTMQQQPVVTHNPFEFILILSLALLITD